MNHKLISESIFLTGQRRIEKRFYRAEIPQYGAITRRVPDMCSNILHIPETTRPSMSKRRITPDGGGGKRS